MSIDKEQQKKINRNNRKRGAKFEKTVANELEMDVVPYSGSNARFGFGDVRDSIWLGECKNVTAEDGYIVIKHEWITKNDERAVNIFRTPFLAFMAFGGQDKYVLMTKEVFDWMSYIYEHNLKTPQLDLALYGKHNTKNIKLPIEPLKQLKPKHGVMNVTVLRESSGELKGVFFPIHDVYIMNISLFKAIRNSTPNLKGTITEGTV